MRRISWTSGFSFPDRSKMSIGWSGSIGMLAFGNLRSCPLECSMWAGEAMVGNHTTLPPKARQRFTACGFSPPTWLLRAIAPNVRIPPSPKPCRSSSATSVAVE